MNCDCSNRVCLIDCIDKREYVFITFRRSLYKARRLFCIDFEVYDKAGGKACHSRITKPGIVLTVEPGNIKTGRKLCIDSEINVGIGAVPGSIMRTAVCKDSVSTTCNSGCQFQTWERIIKGADLNTKRNKRYVWIYVWFKRFWIVFRNDKESEFRTDIYYVKKVDSCVDKTTTSCDIVFLGSSRKERQDYWWGSFYCKFISKGTCKQDGCKDRC